MTGCGIPISWSGAPTIPVARVRRLSCSPTWLRVTGPRQTEAVADSTNQRSDFEFASAVWYWRGPSPYYFVRVPPEVCEDLADLAADVSYGWGMIPVEVTLDGRTWETSLWPKDGGYVVPIRARERLDLGLDTDDLVTLGLRVITRGGRPAARGDL